MLERRCLISIAIFAFFSLALGACGDDGPANGEARSFKGGVTVVTGGGTDKTALVFDEGYPKAEISSRLLVQLVGQAEGRTHTLTLNIDPLKPVPTLYQLPADALPVVVEYRRDGQVTPLGKPYGTIRVNKVDDAGSTGGEALLSLELTDGGGFALLEVDLIF